MNISFSFGQGAGHDLPKDHFGLRASGRILSSSRRIGEELKVVNASVYSLRIFE
ncbi:hypothetical protein ABZV91_11415 [Nocardia sp. NPDC004568]|uniref:hypothetical protein n=1 Tax=Nocardia sp. NPDC004568 TaxID=3154551 RepID=UPI0033AB4558